MTIGGWVLFGFLAMLVVLGCLMVLLSFEQLGAKIISVLATIILIVAMFFGFRWYFTSTASGQRALTDQKSELANGLERSITIYTADGQVMAHYEGRIDIEGNDGGYVIFDYQGCRYTYYNCFVESIAKID